MSGYWKEEIINGHKTGPHRTSINAIKEYEEFYQNQDPDSLEKIKYSTTGSKKLFVNPKNVPNLETITCVSATNKRIPIIINGLNESDIIFTTKKRTEKIEYVKSILNNNEPYIKLFNFINNPDVVCAQISQPNTDSSYKKHITDVVNACITNTPYSVDLSGKFKDKNNWQLFIDNREKRLCFVIWSINEELY